MKSFQGKRAVVTGGGTGRRDPENAYEAAFMSDLRAAGHFGGVASEDSPSA